MQVEGDRHLDHSNVDMYLPFIGHLDDRPDQLRVARGVRDQRRGDFLVVSDGDAEGDNTPQVFVFPQLGFVDALDQAAVDGEELACLLKAPFRSGGRLVNDEAPHRGGSVFNELRIGHYLDEALPAVT